MNEAKENLQRTRELLLNESDEILKNLSGSRSNYNNKIIKEDVYLNRRDKLYKQHRLVIHQINKVDEMLETEDEKTKNIIAGEC